MKILFVQNSLLGHRLDYVKYLSSNACFESISLSNETSGLLNCRQIAYTPPCKNPFFAYIKWLKEIKKIAKSEKADIIHFLDGDQLYRYFGFGLRFLKTPIIITYHHMRFDFLRNISIKRLFSLSKTGVVHTENLLNSLHGMGIKNAQKIEYPYFSSDNISDTLTAKTNYGIPSDKKCISMIGGLTEYKGVNYLLEAMDKVNVPFTLCIAGAPFDYTEEYITNAVKNYRENTVLKLHRLSDTEYTDLISASDIMVFPYKKTFNGASGPMIAAVWQRKPVIGSDFGSMGQVITDNRLGKTFQCENSDDLARVITDAITNGLEWNETAEKFREKLTPEIFADEYLGLYEKYSH